MEIVTQNIVSTQQMQIQHPNEKMTVKERAYQMWAAHPNELDRLGYKNRQDFYEAHMRAAIIDAIVVM
jgi:hypothetical protein